MSTTSHSNPAVAIISAICRSAKLSHDPTDSSRFRIFVLRSFI